MPATDCWLCTTPPGRLSSAALDTACRCGHPLRYHGLGHPHAFAVRDCRALTPVAVPRETPAREVTQLAFLTGETHDSTP